MMLAMSTGLTFADNGPSTTSPTTVEIIYDFNTEGASVKPDGASISPTVEDLANCSQITLSDGKYNGELLKMGSLTIKGWSTKADFTANDAKKYDLGATVPKSDFESAAGGTVTLYAVWPIEELVVDPGSTEPTEPAKDKSPATSDDFMAVSFIVMMILSAVAVAVVRRRNA